MALGCPTAQSVIQTVRMASSTQNQMRPAAVTSYCQRCRSLTYVGEIARSDLASVSLPFVGHGPWKGLRIIRSSGAGVVLLAERAAAENIVAAFA